MDNKNLINVQVVYALPDRQVIKSVTIVNGCTLEQAVIQSGILQECPDIRMGEQKIGVFSKPRQWADLACDGDRIEIYRPLIIDPKEARRAKAKAKKR